jgi:hypothetical protein
MNLRLIPVFSALFSSFALCASAVAAGEIVTVTTLHDVRDFGGAQMIADLPGPDGVVSFGEAVTAVNNQAGPQTIQFAIPPSEYWLVTNIALLELEIGPFVLTDDATTIDFRTQTQFAGDTNPNGWEVGIYGLEPNGWGSAAIFVLGNGCTLIGLDDVHLRGYAVEIQGDRNRVRSFTTDGPLHAAIHVEGVFQGSPASGNVIGGVLPGEGNVVSGGSYGIRIAAPADDNVVIGNTCIGSPHVGISVIGATQYGAFARNNRIGGLAQGEGNWVAANGSFGEEGFPQGNQIEVCDADGTKVLGNTVGTTKDGMANYPLDRGPGGIVVRNARGTLVHENLVSGILHIGTNHYQGQRFGVGILVEGVCEDTVVTANLVGTDALGIGAIPNVRGIVVDPFTALMLPLATSIGGESSALGNTVAFSEGNGVTVHSLVHGVAIRGNRIRENGELGIDLIGPTGGGVTPNDFGDVDDGANHLQNFPVLGRVFTNGATLFVGGGLASTPVQTFAIDFFDNPACDPSGFGEGAVYLGSKTVTTDAQGRVAFLATFASPVPAGHFITATATNLGLGETSEFSACKAVLALP